MIDVLAAPVCYDLTTSRYGKNYHLLNNIRDADIEITSYVGWTDATMRNDSLDVIELENNRKLEYYFDVYRTVNRHLNRYDVDIYHHMNLDYRWFNPVVIANKPDAKFVIGPAKDGHAIFGEEFNRIINNSLGTDLSLRITNPIHSAIENIRGVSIDPIRMKLFSSTLKRADKIIVPHLSAKETYSQFIDENDIEVIPFGIDIQSFEFNPRGGSQEVVSMGALEQRKGYPTLIEAWEQVAQEFPQAHLHIFGKGSLEAELKSRVKNLEIESSITFHGYVNRSVIKDHLEQAQLFVHPSLSEGFSFPRLEAMASGCPVIGSDVKGAQEMIREGVDGYVIPKEDSDILAQHIMDLLADPSLTEEMGTNAREQVEENFNWERIGRRYVQIYRELVQ